MSSASWNKDVNKGRFVRKDSAFRNFIKADGSSPFKPERNRYHIYVSYACPWASRTLMVRKLKGLEDVISFDCVEWFMDSNTGWRFSTEKESDTKDSLYGKKYLSEIYKKAQPDYEGRYTVPVLWDKETKTIVNNESSEIIRMLNKEFNEFCATPEQAAMDLYPSALQEEIDTVNAWIYPMINNGVYRSGFARTQEAYDEAVAEVFQGLDKVEGILEKKRYLMGNELTEADIRLFPTLVRFDKVYVGHFKCNKKRIFDYPNIWAYTRDIYQIPGVADTVNFEHITKHYMMSHTSINPFGIVSIGPDINFLEPHGRENK